MDKLIPGLYRNKPCLCGSGVKAKKCSCDGTKCVTQFRFEPGLFTLRKPGAEIERVRKGRADGIVPNAWRGRSLIKVKPRGADSMRAELAKVGLRRVPVVPTGICTSRGPRKGKNGPVVDGCTAAHREPLREELPCVASDCSKKTLGRQVVLCWDAPACPEHNLRNDYRIEVKLYMNGRIGMIAHRKITIATAP